MNTIRKFVAVPGIYAIQNTMNKKVYVGHSVSEEARAKIAAARKGTKCTFSAEHCAKLSKAKMGIPRPPEVVAKMVAAHKGRPLSQEHRDKLSAALKDRKFSEEHRAKLTAGAKKQWETRSREVSEEQREKLSTAGKKAWIKRRQNATNTPT